MSMSGSQFIDWETGTCNFNSDEFMQMLEFINQFPEKLDEDYYTDLYWMNYDSMWREGKTLAAMQYIGDFRSFNLAEKGNFGEEVTLIGFPSADQDGTAIMPNLQLAMSAKSKNKDGAWEFLRCFLLKDYQEEGYGFPLSIARLEELKVEATQKPYYTDEDGERVEYEETWYTGNEELIIEPMTAQEAEEFAQLLYSLKHVVKSDEALFQILQEEAAAYFSGQKSAADVANIIQSRAQIYVNENR